MILHRGRSRLTRAKEWFNVVVTGLTVKSKNPKTGEMAQVWILPDEPVAIPDDKLQAKENRKIVCGDCKLLTTNSCYVNVAWAPTSIQNAIRNNAYPQLNLDKLEGTSLRWGAYGEPSIIPFKLMTKINKLVRMFTGYTHQWHKKWAQPYKKFLMASCQSKSEKETANQKGWRSFRIGSSVNDILEDEVLCPSSKEYELISGKRSPCIRCNLCCGTSARIKKNIFIVGHGGSSVKSNILKLIEKDN
jgi:hypothetical protein